MVQMLCYESYTGWGKSIPYPHTGDSNPTLREGPWLCAGISEGARIKNKGNFIREEIRLYGQSVVSPQSQRMRP